VVLGGARPRDRFGWDHHDRAGGVLHDGVQDASQQQGPDASAATGADDDGVGVDLVGDGEDRRGDAGAPPDASTSAEALLDVVRFISRTSTSLRRASSIRSSNDRLEKHSTETRPMASSSAAYFNRELLPTPVSPYISTCPPRSLNASRSES